MLNEFASWLVNTLESVLDGMGPEFDELDNGLIDLQCGGRVFNDVPAKMRTELWLSALQREKGKGAAAVAQYPKLSASPISGDVLGEIEKDTHRTFPGHPWLSKRAGQLSMLRILRAYAALDPEVGYSQGMNFLAGLFLTYLDEPAAFGALTLVMQDRKLRELYKPGDGMAHLQIRLWQLGNLISPKLAAHLEAHAVLPVLYASSWLLTCFAAEFPISFAARIMDVVISDSYAAPLMKVAVKIVERCERELVAMDDMEEMVTLLRQSVPSWPKSKLQDLLTDALGQPWNSRQIAILQKINGAESVADAVMRVEAVAKTTGSSDNKNQHVPPSTPPQPELSDQQRRPTSSSSSSSYSTSQKAIALPLPPPPSSKKDKVDWSHWTSSSPESTVPLDAARIETTLMDVPLSPTLSHALERYSSRRNSPKKKENSNDAVMHPSKDDPPAVADAGHSTRGAHDDAAQARTPPTPTTTVNLLASPMACIEDTGSMKTDAASTIDKTELENGLVNTVSSSDDSFFLTQRGTTSSMPSPFESTAASLASDSRSHSIATAMTPAASTGAIHAAQHSNENTYSNFTGDSMNHGSSSGFTDFIDASPGKESLPGELHANTVDNGSGIHGQMSGQESIMQLLGKLKIEGPARGGSMRHGLAGALSDFGSYKDAGDEFGSSAGRPMHVESQNLSSTLASATTSQALLMQHSVVENTRKNCTSTHSLIVAFNRDESFERETLPLHEWNDGSKIIGGRDNAAGGTWLCCSSATKRLAFLTNVTDATNNTTTVVSRGCLPTNFVIGSGSNAIDYISKIDPNAYAHFNLILCDLLNGTPSPRLWYATNSSATGNAMDYAEIQPGIIHGVSNAPSIDTVDWPKIHVGRQRLQDLVDRGCLDNPLLATTHTDGQNHDKDIFPWDEIFEIMQDKTILEEDPAKLPHIGYAPEFESLACAVCINPLQYGAHLYGTRSITVLVVQRDGLVEIREKSFHVHKGGLHTTEERLQFNLS